MCLIPNHKRSNYNYQDPIVLRLLKCHKAGHVKQVEYNVWIAFKRIKKLVKGFFGKIMFYEYFIFILFLKLIIIVSYSVARNICLQKSRT